MKQTNKYKLNLIEGSDDVSLVPLNENTEKIDAQLAQIGALAELSCLRKLAGPVGQTVEDSTQTMSLAGVDMSQYQALLLVCYINGGYNSFVCANGSGIAQAAQNGGGNGDYTSLVWLTPIGTTGVAAQGMYNKVSGYTPTAFSGNLTTCGWTSIRELSLTRTGVGSTCTVYGIRA